MGTGRNVAASRHASPVPAKVVAPAALVSDVVAQYSPIVTLDVRGMRSAVSLWQAVFAVTLTVALVRFDALAPGRSRTPRAGARTTQC